MRFNPSLILIVATLCSVTSATTSSPSTNAISSFESAKSISIVRRKRQSKQGIVRGSRSNLREANENEESAIIAKSDVVLTTQSESNDSLRAFLCVLGGTLMHFTFGTLYCWGNFNSYAPSFLSFFDGKEHPGKSFSYC